MPEEMTEEAEPRATRFCIVEDHRATRETFLKLLKHGAGIICAGVCSNGEEALEAIPRLMPDVVLMDINLPGVGGIECVAILKRAHPQIEFVMLTTYDDTDLIFDALRAGASGYLLKRAAPEELLGAIDEVRRGGSPMSMEIARRVVSHFHQIRQPAGEADTLTKREREILELLAKGLPYKQIADQLGLSPHTVHNRLRGIYRKLHVQSGTEAVAKFLRG
jgi:DNA-binding NarL/FixJ family response regulator